MATLPIYLDYHATTPVDARVVDVVVRHMTTAFGNASSRDHTYGDQAEEAVEIAAAEVAGLIGAEVRDIVFTSGATEAANLALKGIAWAAETRLGRPLRIGAMPVEHHSVLNTCQYLAEHRLAEISYFHVDDCAQLDLDDFRKKCREGLDVVAVMGANNEVGTIYPLAAAGAIARDFGILLFSDLTQAAGKIPIDMAAWGVDLAAMSAHKMYGPKGVGALVLSQGIKLHPLLHGGAHQRGLRSGTLNVPGIAGFGAACRLRSQEMHVDEPRIAHLRDRLQSMLLQERPNVVVNGDLQRRLAGNLNLSYLGVPNGAIIARLRDRVAIATGSACSSGIEAPSHVLRAMNLSPDRVEGALRIGLGKFTTQSEIEVAAMHLSGATSEISLLV